MELEALTENIDRLVELGASALSDGASIEILERQLARLKSLVTTAVADFDVTP
jgi:hypothetical protein